MTASLDDDNLKIVGHTTRGDFAVEGVLRAVPPGPLVIGCNTQDLSCGSQIDTVPPPTRARSVVDGVFQVPPITANGKRYPRQSIPFGKRTLTMVDSSLDSRRHVY